MTNGAAILEDLQPFPVRRSLIERQCIKHGLSPIEDVDDESKIAICVIEILSQMVALNNVGESGVSISFNKEAVEATIRRKCIEIGLDSSLYIKEATVRRLDL